jgi:predicted permease
VALFCIGGTLAGLSLKGMGSDLGLLVAGKLLLHPLAVFVAMLAFPVADPQMKTAVLLNAAMPMMSMYPILGLRYGREGSAQRRCSRPRCARSSRSARRCG